jgi:deoxyribodipyrimidine photo-lyase
MDRREIESARMLAPLHVVWYKRDLRVADHAPLAEAAARGPVLPLYIIEPSLLRAPDFDPCHWTFIRASLIELRARLAGLGQPLVVRVGEVVEVLERLAQAASLAALWAHEETGSLLTYRRDRAVIRWARGRGLPFHELPQTGVVRRLRDRDRWEGQYRAHIIAPQAQPPARLTPMPGFDPGPIPEHAALGLAADVRTGAQPAGEGAAHALLNSFLRERGRGYQRAMSSPLSAAASCSRLSPHLAWGTISPRTAVQAAQARLMEARARRDGWERSLTAFLNRLRWRSHFMQKLEDEPEIETRSFIPAYDALREGFRQPFLDAWAAGQTGYPFVDACLRALMHTGWLNFRMRAMIVSFAAYQLWLPWQAFATARPCVWLDFEPGIHYPQFQMQSGTTGINTLRIYNPVKQSLDQDPDGAFIRRYLPELAIVPTSYLHQPWLMPGRMQQSIGVVLGRDYPIPIVDHEAAARAAREAVWALRQGPAMQAAADAVRQKHASRRSTRSGRRPAKRADGPAQLPLLGF